jgi:hypothetical protein
MIASSGNRWLWFGFYSNGGLDVGYAHRRRGVSKAEEDLFGFGYIDVFHLHNKVDCGAGGVATKAIPKSFFWGDSKRRRIIIMEWATALMLVTLLFYGDAVRLEEAY